MSDLEAIHEEYKNRRMHVKRKIKNGKVKIYQHYYKPDETHQEYKGELDGLFGWFGLYPHSDHSFVALIDFPGFTWEEQPNHIEGYVCWYFWNKEGNRESNRENNREDK